MIWNHVISKDNPAVVVPRGMCASQFKALSLLLNGPKFFNKSSEYWPCKEENANSVDRSIKGIQVIQDFKYCWHTC